MRSRHIIAIAAAALALCAASAYAAEAPARVATLSFDRPTHYEDNTPIPASGVAVSYNVYQGAKGSATKAKVATITETGVTINTGLAPGETCWEVTAVANGKESARSNEGCKVFEFSPPRAITITVT